MTADRTVPTVEGERQPWFTPLRASGAGRGATRTTRRITTTRGVTASCTG